MKVGILLGRFQPFHLGHLQLMVRILSECDRLVVCVGSAQKPEPYTGDERVSLIRQQMAELGLSHRVEVFQMVDPEPLDLWPERLVNICQIRSEDNNVLYRSDLDIPLVQRWRLRDLGVTLKIVQRKPFFYRCPDGIHRLVSSASDIKRLDPDYSRRV